MKFGHTWIRDSPDVRTPFLSIHGLLEKLQEENNKALSEVIYHGFNRTIGKKEKRDNW